MVFGALCAALFWSFFVVPPAAHAQYSADLNSAIYDDIDVWEGRGYIRQLPIFRPLPETVLVSLMREVIKNGDLAAQQKATEYFKQLTGLYLSSDLYFFNYLKFSGTTAEAEDPIVWRGSGALIGSFMSFLGTPLVSASVGFGLKPIADKDDASNVEDIRPLALGERYGNKIEEIPDSFRVATVNGVGLKAFLEARTSFAAGLPNAFLHAGLMRRSIGPFFDDGLIVSSRAPQTGNLFVHWRGKKVAATWGLFMLTSTQEFDRFTSPTDFSKNASYRFNKVFFYNSLSWYITPNVEFNIFESVMFGDFNFAYLLPIKIIYAIDGLSSFIAGNLFLGFSFDFRIADTVKIPVSFIVDDINVNDLIRFKFDTKLKLAAETGITWTPRQSILQQLSLNYQIVLPYTYSHSRTGDTLYSNEFNTSNHTTRGESLATSLPPSSHRVKVKATFSPLDALKFGFSFQFSQHNNPSAGILKGPLNDGSIVDDGYYSKAYDNKEGPSFQNRNGFLSGTIEHTIEPAVFIGASIPVFNHTTLYADVSYTYRYIINYGLKEGVNKSEHIMLFYVGFKIDDF